MKQFIWLLVGCLNFLAVSSEASTDLLEAICVDSNKEAKTSFTNLDGLSWLVDHLGGLSSYHKFYNCGNKYLESLKELVTVVKTDANNVCSHEKLTLMEDYHRKYVSKARKHSKHLQQGQAPQMAKLFFMQYASEVSSVCEQSAMKAINNYGQKLSADKLAKMESLRKFTDTMGMTEFSKGYDGIYLFWNMVDALGLARSEKFSKYLSEGGNVRVNIQMKNAQGLSGLQAFCRYQLRPVYSKSLLPVLRLVDMGYYPQSNELIRELQSESAARALFYAAQVCETFLPVGVYLDEKLNDNQVTALTKEEAGQLTPYEPQGLTAAMKTEPVLEVSLSSVDANKLDNDIAGRKIIKKSVEHRDRVVSRMLRQFVKQLKKKLKSTFKGFKLFHRDQNKKLQTIDESQLEQVDESSLQINDEDESPREKRGLGLGLLFISICFFYAVYLALLLAFKLIFFSAPFLFFLGFALIGHEDSQEITIWFLTCGLHPLERMGLKDWPEGHYESKDAQPEDYDFNLRNQLVMQPMV